MSPPPPRLTRSRRHRLIGGVCAGLARRLGWNRWLVRLLFVLCSLIPVLPGLPVYLLLWWAVPLEERHDAPLPLGAPMS